jgi:uncharacterized protein (TIGR03067 family)
MKRFLGPAALAVLVLGAGVRGDDNALKGMEGNWDLKREEKSGNLTHSADSRGHHPRAVIEGNLFSWYRGDPAPNQVAEIEVDATKSPKTIDALITRGSNRNKKMLGIYKFDGKTLEICWGGAGTDKRPTKFATRPGVGAGVIYEKYEREKEK